MKKKILFTATVWAFFDFLKHDIRMLVQEGWEVHVATNFRVVHKPIEVDGIVVKHQIDFARSPLDKDNMTAYRQLTALLREEPFDIIHCHTVIASVVTRLAAARYRKRGTKLIYTAHGLNFYKGAPKSSWLLYYPVEWLLSFLTDTQVTINTEDYELTKRCFHSGEKRYIPGVGVDLSRYHPDRVVGAAKRRELGLSEEELMLLLVGEMIPRKNHEVVLRALSMLDDPRLRLFIAGKGTLEDRLKALCTELGIEDKVGFLGYREDVDELCQTADLFLLSSHHEGLSVALMEAIGCETPVLGSRIRGNNDLITDGSWMFDQHSAKELAENLRDKLGSRTRAEFHAFAAEVVRKNRERLNSFGLDAVREKVRELYGLDKE